MNLRDEETREERAARYERGDVTPHPSTKVYEESEGGFTFDDIVLTGSEREHFDQLMKAGRSSPSSIRGMGSSPKL